MVVGALILAVAVVAWLYFLWSRRRFYMCALKMKGPWGYPFIGIAHKLHKLEDILYVLPNYAREYKQKSILTWIGPFPIVYTIDPKITEMVLHSPDCMHRGIMYQPLDDAIGTGILTSKFPQWAQTRKLLSPSFRSKVLLGSMPIFNNFARQICRQLDKHVGCGEVDINELALKMSLKSSFTTSMGIYVEEGSDSKLLQSFENILEIVLYRALRPWLINKTVFSWTSAYKSISEAKTCIANFIQELIDSKLKTFENTKHELDTNSYKDSVENEKASSIFIDQAIKCYLQNELTIDDIVIETTLIMIANYEATGRALFSTLMFLAMNPHYQDRAFEEISTVYQDKQFDVNNDDFKNLIYLEMCINEALRLAPPFPVIGRVCDKDVRISEHITVPAGTEIYMDIFNIHRDESVWGPSAKTYNPENFLPSNLQNKHKCAFLPFSKGKRNCMGWQYAGKFLRVMLAKILRQYKFSTTFRYEDLKFMECVSMRCVTTPRLEVQRR